MAQMHNHPVEPSSVPRQIPPRTTTALSIPPPPPPPSTSTSSQPHARNSQLGLNTFSPVNQNGSFDFDRVLKSGFVQKRTRKTKAWKPIFLVLRPNSLSIYKDQNEDKLKHKIYLTDLTAVAFLKDPKQKRQNVFGLFSPSRNYHLEAQSEQDAAEWVELVRREARIEEEEEELLLASPGGNMTGSFLGFGHAMQQQQQQRQHEEQRRLHEERLGSSSPEPSEPIARPSRHRALGVPVHRRPSHTIEYSGNEVASHSDMSEAELTRSAASVLEEPLAVKAPGVVGGVDPMLVARNISQMSGFNAEQDPERVVWQGHLLYLRSKGGVRQWKDLWAVIRPRNIALYKNDSEYSPILIIPLSGVINAVEIDPLSKTKNHCLQVITEEKSYKFCAHNEDTLDTSLGAIKSLLARRKEAEMGIRR